MSERRALNHEELLTVLGLFAFDNCDELFWRTDGEYAPLWIGVDCSDFFDWGTSDLEEILPGDLPLLQQSFADVRAVTGRRWDSGGTLFCARKRQMRPQGACYEHIKKALWPLFNAAGPERETGLFNPRPIPSDGVS